MMGVPTRSGGGRRCEDGLCRRIGGEHEFDLHVRDRHLLGRAELGMGGKHRKGPVVQPVDGRQDRPAAGAGLMGGDPGVGEEGRHRPVQRRSATIRQSRSRISAGQGACRSIIQPIAGRTWAISSAASGGVLVGWGLMIWHLAGEALARMPEAVRAIIRTPVLTSSVVDSAASVAAGAALNVVVSLVFLALFLIPVRGERAQATA